MKKGNVDWDNFNTDLQLFETRIGSTIFRNLPNKITDDREGFHLLFYVDINAGKPEKRVATTPTIG
jgi:hypothetical protein